MRYAWARQFCRMAQQGIWKLPPGVPAPERCQQRRMPRHVDARATPTTRAPRSTMRGSRSKGCAMRRPSQWQRSLEGQSKGGAALAAKAAAQVSGPSPRAVAGDAVAALVQKFEEANITKGHSRKEGGREGGRDGGKEGGRKGGRESESERERETDTESDPLELQHT